MSEPFTLARIGAVHVFTDLNNNPTASFTVQQEGTDGDDRRLDLRLEVPFLSRRDLHDASLTDGTISVHIQGHQWNGARTKNTLIGVGMDLTPKEARAIARALNQLARMKEAQS